MGVLLSRISNEEIQAKRKATTDTTDCEIQTINSDSGKTISECLDQIQDCIAEIRECDLSRVPTEEQTSIKAKAGIKFAFPHL